MSTPPTPTPERPHLFLVRLSGELSIKAKGTRNRFTRKLARNIEDALRASGYDFELQRTWSRLFVTASSPDAGLTIGRVFGVASVSRVEHRTWESLDDVLKAGEEIFAPLVAGKSFAVRARRSERRFVPFRSGDVDRQLGALLLPHARKVDLTSPEITVRIEIHQGRAFYFSSSVDGEDGLPLGVSGRAVALVSGGFDSIVAAWLMLRRGLALDYVFLNLGGAKHRDGTLAVMKVLSDRWSYGYRPKLHMIDFQPVVEELEAKCSPHLWQVILKRQMLRAAERVSRRIGCSAIVTGESVGQVSSQTLQNLTVISRATDRLVLRPLSGSNKEDIFVWARRIGSFDLSAKVPEYCALTHKEPATAATLGRVAEAEEGLDPELVLRMTEERAVLDLRALDLEKMVSTEFEVEAVPPGATVVDLRSATAFSGWHYPEAIHLDYFRALQAWPSFDREKTWVFYCEVGLKSAHLAEVMREAGITAFHVKDGLKTVKRAFEDQDPALKALLSPVLLD